MPTILLWLPKILGIAGLALMGGIALRTDIGKYKNTYTYPKHILVTLWLGIAILAVGAILFIVYTAYGVYPSN